ncbi:MAG: hypothetical protein ABGY95_01135 [Rubritalea sp.]|uniref:hypothetical protein n=1 Tax=Rubritalea sp. TaxID=2109375 RepID=UPI003242F375
MDKFLVWEVMSYAWTEIGLEKSDYPEYAKKIYSQCDDWKTIDQIITKDVCGSFSQDTFLIFPCMLWMIMPDWGYNKEYIKERMQHWYSKPAWQHYLNPLRLLGYPLALVFSLSVRRKLKKAFALCSSHT